jgi:GNAT superfamily N-acetyltransferase
MNVQRAGAADAEHILRMRRAAEDWLAERAIEQWPRGRVSLADVLGQIGRGEWHVVRCAGRPCGGLRLLWSDERVWQRDNAFAAYVHGLVIDRRHAGDGVGARLLRWAAEQGRVAGVRWLRLDCVQHNTRLRRYYADQGFREVGRRRLSPTWCAVLLEKALV